MDEFDGKWDMFLSVFKDGKEQDCRLKLDRASRPTVRAYTLTDTYLTDDVATADDIEVERLSDVPSLQADPDSVFLLDNVDVYGQDLSQWISVIRPTPISLPRALTSLP